MNPSNNPALYASTEEVKASYHLAYRFHCATPAQLRKQVSKHYRSQAALLLSASLLPCDIALVIRLAVHFKCQYHEVLGKMVAEHLTRVDTVLAMSPVAQPATKPKTSLNLIHRKGRSIPTCSNTVISF